jgi:hypothetical protein
MFSLSEGRAAEVGFGIDLSMSKVGKPAHLKMRLETLHTFLGWNLRWPSSNQLAADNGTRDGDHRGGAIRGGIATPGQPRYQVLQVGLRLRVYDGRVVRWIFRAMSNSVPVRWRTGFRSHAEHRSDFMANSIPT